MLIALLVSRFIIACFLSRKVFIRFKGKINGNSDLTGTNLVITNLIIFSKALILIYIINSYLGLLRYNLFKTGFIFFKNSSFINSFIIAPLLFTLVFKLLI